MRFTYRCLLHLALVLLSANTVTTHASTAYFWAAYIPSHPAGLEPNKFSDYKSACDSLRRTVYYYQQREYVQGASNHYYCYILDRISGNREWIGQANGQTLSCPNGHNTDYQCNTFTPTCQYGVFDTVSNQCVSASDKGQPDGSCTSSYSGTTSELRTLTGNPINFLSGNKFHQETYFQSAQSGGISFVRTYNSADAVWRHSYSDRLIFTNNTIRLILADGKELRYSSTGAPIDGAAARFGALSSKGGDWELSAKGGVVYKFDHQGRLASIKLINGQSHQLSYTETSGISQALVSDGLGNQVSFKQAAQGNLIAFNAPGTTMSFSHNSYGSLVKAQKTINGQSMTREYHYEDPRNVLLMTGLTDERGVRYATWRYDSQGRAISSEHIGGADKVSVTYNSDLSTTVTNELGKKTTYQFSIIDGSKRITAIQGQPSANCPNSNSTFTYDSQGLLKTKTDNKGNLTTYDYNARGLEISRTEASGKPEARTITTDWHPTLFLPAVVTEPDRITTYHYDDQGRQLSRTVEER